MSIQIVAQSATIALEDHGVVAVPLSSPACALQGMDVTVAGRPDARTGLWECSPGRFQRQMATGEVMHILAGSGRFEPAAAGEPTVSFRAGDTLFFPPETFGAWEIVETVRKVYVMI